MQRLFAALLALQFLVACSSSAPVVEPPTPLQALEPELAVTTLWQVDAGAVINRRRIPLTPIVDAERVYVTDLNGLLSAYARGDGRRLWRRDVAMRVNAGPGVGRDQLYLVGERGRIVAVSRVNGEPVWEAIASSEVLSPPLEFGDRLIVRSVDGRVQSRAVTDGSAQWSFFRDVPALSLRGTSQPLAIARRLVIGLDDGRLVALNPADGEVLWERTLAQPSGRSEVERLVDIDGDPVADNDDIYAVAYQGRVARITADGRTLWTRPASSVLRPEIAGEHLILVDASSEIHALHRVSGTEVWRQDLLRGRSLTAATAVGDYLVVGDFDGYLHWLSREDGRLLARQRVDDYAIVAAPVAADGVIYVHTQGGVLAALRAQPVEP